MPQRYLVLALSIVTLASVVGGCQFYPEGVPDDAGAMVVDRDNDAADMDPDAEPLDGSVTPDVSPQADAAIEECGQVGGVCTSTPGVICPPGTLPYRDDEPLDCGGHCCVPDGESTCNSDPDTNCTMSAACTGCWAPAAATALVCFAGRPCCEWTCGG